MKFGSKKEGGFTMVELIVAMSVFVILLTVAVGIFTRTVRSQRSLVHRMAVNNNAGLVLEQITRDIRTGYFFCGDGTVSCDESSFLINFTNYKGEATAYFLENGVIKKTVEENTVGLTASDVVVKDLEFVVKQTGDDICAPWRVIIRMRVGSEKTEPSRDINLQTTVSSRVLPVEAAGVPQEVINKCQ